MPYFWNDEEFRGEEVPGARPEHQEEAFHQDRPEAFLEDQGEAFAAASPEDQEAVACSP